MSIKDTHTKKNTNITLKIVVKSQGKIAKGNQKKTGEAILITGKIDFI